MLVLSRKLRQKILVGDDIVIELMRVGPNSARIGITAPENVNIRREELEAFDDIEQEQYTEPTAKPA